MAGQAFEAFVAPARARPALWRLIAGLALGTAAYFASVAAVLGIAALLSGGGAALSVMQSGAYLTLSVPTLVLLFSFVGMALGAVVAAAALHRRGPRSLIGPLRQSARQFLIAAGLTWVVFLPSVALWTMFFDPDPNLALGRWLALLPLTVAALLIQTLAEEMVFRGYLMQQLAARFASRLVWFWLPSAIFGAIHYDPSMGGDAALWLIASPLAFGILAADLTVRTGALGAAWGFHFANNFVAIGLLSTKGTITGLSLFTTPYAAEDLGEIGPLLATDMVLLLVAWAVLRRVLTVRS